MEAVDEIAVSTSLCVDTIKGIVKPSEEISLFDQVDFVKSLCSLMAKLNASVGIEAAVTARTRIERIKLRVCEVLPYGREFSLKMKRRIYQSCARSLILRRTEKAMIRAMCGVTLVEKKSQELMSLLGLKDILDGLSGASEL